MASKENPGRVGVGCVIRNHSGNTLRASYSRILDASNNIVEAQAFLEGIKMSLDMGFKKLDR